MAALSGFNFPHNTWYGVLFLLVHSFISWLPGGSEEVDELTHCNFAAGIVAER